MKGHLRENSPKTRRIPNARKIVAEKMTELALPPLEEKPQEPDAADAIVPFPVVAECNRRSFFLAGRTKLVIPRCGFQAEPNKQKSKFSKRNYDRHDWSEYSN